jgi:hypothetical protein
MINTITGAHGGGILYHSEPPGRRRRRARLYGLAVIAVVALSGGVINAFQAQQTFESNLSVAGPEMASGPFAYYPR